MPGVEAAMAPRSTSVSSGTDRVWTFRMASRPARSGGTTTTRRSKRPGRSRAWSTISGRVEAVHLGEDLVQRLLALVVAARQVGAARGPRAADGVELVDEDDRGRR